MEKEFDPIKKGAAFLLDKPKSWTSFDVVGKLRSLLKEHYSVRRLKVGHAGTLDPMATGLLICCSGPMTKRISEYQDADKEYRAKVRLGERTASCDAETEATSSSPVEHLNLEKVEEALNAFVGEIRQVPPAFSAVRVNGKRAYQEARKGKDPKLDPRIVQVHGIEVEAFELPEVDLSIRCGKGTYIRSLARDLGEKLECGAHLKELRRTRIGEYRIEDAWTIEGIKAFLKEEKNAKAAKEKKP